MTDLHPDILLALLESDLGEIQVSEDQILESSELPATSEDLDTEAA